MRGFMLDSARGLESRDYYRRFIDFSAERGMDTLLWHFTDDQGCSLRFDSLAAAASPNAYTKAEMRELVAYASDKGVRLIPELETLGHTRFITRLPEYSDLAENDEFFSSICPVSERTRSLMAKLLDETLATFDSPIIHVGLDETNFGDHPLTVAALASRSHGQLFADYINFLHAHLARSGRRMMMWGDHLLKDPSIAPLIPRDVLIANWQYAPDAPFGSTEQLVGWGFEVVVCPALVSHNQTLGPGEAFSLPNLRQIARHQQLSELVGGMVTTIWTPPRYLPNALWPALDYAAAVMRDGPDVATRPTLTQFARDFFGIGQPGAWASAMDQLFAGLPRREKWLAAVRVDFRNGRDADDYTAEVDRITGIAHTLRQTRPQIRRNHSSYDALLLLVDLMLHVNQRAERLLTSGPSEAMLEQSEELQERLATAWDEDRFANDPRKWTPAFSFDEGNHLLVVFAEGTRKLRRLLTPPSLETA